MKTLVVRRFSGLADYRETLSAMQVFTGNRGPATPDEIHFLQHPPVYTLGMAGREDHVLNPEGINVVNSDRGGQVTYHGPGQLVAYLLIDLGRKGITIKQYVNLLEQAVINMLADLSIKALRKEKAPGVYIDARKIAAIGVRVRKGCCYHGLSLNVDMDLSPFKGIDPCGYPGLEVTQLKDEGIIMSVEEAEEMLLTHLIDVLGFNDYQIEKLNQLPDTCVYKQDKAFAGTLADLL